MSKLQEVNEVEDVLSLWVQDGWPHPMETACILQKANERETETEIIQGSFYLVPIVLYIVSSTVSDVSVVLLCSLTSTPKKNLKCTLSTCSFYGCPNCCNGLTKSIDLLYKQQKNIAWI